ncbi:hypothetical protein HHE92_09560 [Pseudoalteromonas arctica]|uniref:hypothetical protein n=1 Tax=Pseudoalteromonas arctica TaxID=394751 RepID=UPI00145C31B9|nr:hypothetical protein [Pseudoalteromonas arctica]NMP80046.1 hypothetical protein [Pseudoalteromonas arctica]
MNIQQKLFSKANELINVKPLGIDLTELDISQIYYEKENSPELRERITRFGRILEQSEGLKQLTSDYYREHDEKIHAFKDAIIYQELIQILTFVEFFNPLKEKFESGTELEKIAIAFSSLRMNKIRNSIAHYDWTIEGQNIKFLDRKFSYSVPYIEVSLLASLFSMIGLYLVKDVAEINNP